MAELTREQQILVALQTANARLKEFDAHRYEPIAVVGMALRLPGGAATDEAYWRLLADKRDAIVEVPRDRWNIDDYYDADPDAPGKMATRFGGFLRDANVRAFDASFFGIAAKEAASLDPQQRLLLECVWHAIEDAGYDPAELAGSRTGVFVGICTHDYDTLLAERGIERIDPYRGTGNAFSAAAGRISYVFAFEGPSLAVDTACSSSLYALHQAELSLRNGECDNAIVAGVNLILAPDNTVYFSKGRFMAPDGRCKTFDAKANGYVRGEGVGVLMLRRQSDATRANDRVRALVRGSALNQDGRSGGLTVPNGPAQEAVIRAALQQARLKPLDVSYVEAHGTGTPLGDPIEVNALAAVYGAGRDRQRPLLVGSVKTNIGHLEAAAGMASIIKVILALEHETLPPQLHLQQPSPKIAWGDLPVAIVSDAVPWHREPGKPRRAGISAFAFQGSNAHVILEEPPVAPSPSVAASSDVHLLVLSARGADAVAVQAAQLAAHLEVTRDDLADVCYSLIRHRAALSHRVAMIVKDKADAIAKLRTVADGERSAEVFIGEASGSAVSAPPADLQALARAFVDGRADLRRVPALMQGRRVRLPHYVFRPTQHWLDAIGSARVASGVVEYSLLGGELDVADSDARRFVTTLSDQAPSWLSDHRVQGEVVVPAAALIELMLEAARTVFGVDAVAVSDVALERALILRGPTQVQVSCDRLGEVVVHARQRGAASSWVACARGRVQKDATLTGSAVALEHLRATATHEGLPRDLYARLAAAGLHYGPQFQTLRSARESHDGWLVEVASEASAPFVLAPPLLDGCLHALAMKLGEGGAAYLPVACERLTVTNRRSPGRVFAHVRLAEGSGEARAELDLYDEHGDRIAEVRGLLLRRVSADAMARQASNVESLTYEIVWRESPAATAGDRDDEWKVIGDEAIAKALRSRDDADGVVWVAPRVDEASTQEQLERVLGELLALAKTMIARAAPSRLVVVTEQAHTLGDRRARRPWHAAAWGFVRVLAAEHPEIACTLIDVDDYAADAERISAELRRLSDDELGFASGRRFAARLVRARLPAVASAISSDGCHLITGGLGAIGQHVASWLAELGAKHIVLLGRGAPNADAQARIAELISRGCRVIVERADVADEAAMRAVIARTGKIGGIFHAAGVLDDALLAHQTWEKFQAVTTAKVVGAELLRRLAPDAPLYCFGSAAAVFGNRGQSNYAAANAYLAGLAERDPGLVQTVDWWAWAETGMAARLDKRRGIERPLVPSEALRVLEQAIAAKRSNLLVTTLDLGRVARTTPELLRSSKFKELVTIVPRASGALFDQVSAQKEDARKSFLARRVAEEASAVLGGAKVTLDAPLTELGFDSLMAVDLGNRLSALTGVTLPSTLAFDYPTATRIADYLYERWFGAAAKVVRSRPRGARSDDEPIAIVGMAGRFPGARNVEDYWRLLDAGGDAIETFPRERWDAAALYDPDPDAPGKTYCTSGGFLHELDLFDAPFFAIPPGEAEVIDPQQRLLLETTFEALERANIPPHTLMGTTAGVYVGLMYHDFATPFLQNPKELSGFVGTGSAASVASGRISYVLGVQGPSMTIDTACSSSLVTVHLAAAALRAGECDLALAGGATVMSSPSTFIEFSRLRGLSKDGRCHSFGDGADGVGWAEGCGMLVLKRASDAIRDGDVILAYVRSSAVNQDGRSNGLTAPNGPSQERVIEAALERAGLRPDEIDYVEAHGTGTALGDPIEAGALAAVYGKHRQRPLLLGSAKSNIGHTQAAAGVAGIMKIVLSLQHERLPPTLHSSTPSHHVRWEGSNLQLIGNGAPWRRGRAPRRAGVSSFGISGTNAHVIVEEAPPPRLTTAIARPVHVLPLSAKSETALAALIDRYVAFLTTTDASFADIAGSAAVGRTHYAHRVAVVAATAVEAAQALRSRAGRRSDAPPPIVFVGDRRDVKDRLAALGLQFETEASPGAFVIDGGLEWTETKVAEILALLYEAGVAIDWNSYAGEPNKVSLPTYPFERRRYWRDEPGAISLERLWAAVVATQTSPFDPGAARHITRLEDAARAYAAIALRESGSIDPRYDRLIDQWQRLLRERPPADPKAIDAIATDTGAEAQLLHRCGPRLAAVLRGEEDPRQLLFPNGSSELLTRLYAEAYAPHYFNSTLRDAVQSLVRSLPSDRMIRVLEVGGGTASTSSSVLPILSPAHSEYTFTDVSSWFMAAAKERLGKFPQVVYRTLDLDRDPEPQGYAAESYDIVIAVNVLHATRNLSATLARVGRLLRRGGVLLATEITTPGFFFDTTFGLVLQEIDREGERTSGGAFLSCDAWQRALATARMSSFVALPRVDVGQHVLIAQRSDGGVSAFSDVAAARAVEAPSADAGPLGARHDSASGRTSFTRRLAAAAFAGHRVYGGAIVPAAAIVTWMQAAAARLLNTDATEISRLTLERALHATDGAAVQVELERTADGLTLSMYSREGDAWLRHATATATRVEHAASVTELEGLWAGLAEHDVVAFYDGVSSRGLDYAGVYRSIKRLAADTARVVAEVQSDDPVALLDGCLQSGLALADAGSRAALMPTAMDGFWCKALPTRVVCETRVRHAESSRRVVDVSLRHPSGELIAEIVGLTAQLVERESLADDRVSWLYEEQWQPAPLKSADTVSAQRFLVLGARALADALLRRGHDVRHLDSLDALASVEPAPLVWAPERERLAESVAALREQQRRQTEIALTASRWAVKHAQALTVVTTSVHASEVNVAQSPLWGFVRALDNEHPELGCRLIDAADDALDAVCVELEGASGEPEVRLDGARSVMRLAPRQPPRLLPPANVENFRLRSLGSSDTLAFVPSRRPTLDAGEVELEVRAVGLNFHDVLTAMSAIGVTAAGEDELGSDVCGVITAVGANVNGLSPGDLVFGIAAGAIVGHAKARAELVRRVPASLTAAQAASMPTVFATLFSSFAQAGPLRRGESVLIHAATGGIGLAAIQLAKRAGAIVYATAGSEQKRAHLRRLGVEHIYDSRTLSFAEDIRRDTAGKGVDVVINSFTGDVLEASVRLLSAGGRFIELGRRDIRTQEQMESLTPGVRYFVINLAKQAIEAPQQVAPLLDELVRGGYEPLPTTCFAFEAADRAFTYLGRAKHIGKVILERSPIVRGDRSYLVVGGKRGIGALAAERLVAMGARHVAVLGRRDADEIAAACFDRMRSAGATILPLSADVANEAELARALGELREKLPPLAGVVQSAGVLSDAVVENQTVESFERVFAPKVYGSWSLTRLLADTPLDFFVWYSSVASVLGSKGQSNHAAACAFEDALARSLSGTATLSIQWGGWAQVGAAAERGASERAKRAGIEFIEPNAGLRAFEELLNGVRAGGHSVFASPISWSSFTAVSEARLKTVFSLHVRSNTPVAGQSALVDQLRAAPVARRHELLAGAIAGHVKEVLGADRSGGVSADKPLMDLGLDSLMAVDLRGRLSRLIGKQLAATLMFDYPTIDAITEYLLRDVLILREAPVQASAAARVTNATQDPIAIVGLSCRFPGAGRDADGFWDLLSRGENGISEVPSSRWDIDAYYSPDPSEPGKMSTRYGGFVDGIDQFDADFFGISPREADYLDPQQRLLLEHTELALEDAGIAPASLKGTRTGVFVGVSNVDYVRLLGEDPRVAYGFQEQLGNALSFAAGRISYVYGLQGPSISIDTACSSSLVALAQATQALRSGTCDTAIVCGVNLILMPGVSITLSSMRTQAPDGQCKTFDDQADGFVRAEGCGVIVLQRQRDAEAYGARIRAVVRGVAVNQDGRSSGITAPNGPAQQAVIEQALADARLSPTDVALVEAHGTGTALGDPIEVQALGAVYGRGRDPRRPLIVGSAKTNIGHAESAAGIAGIIKVAMMLDREEIAPHRNLERLSRHVDWAALPLSIARRKERWPRSSRRRVAAVSSFGISGTNAHAILEEAPPVVARVSFERPCQLLVLSARSRNALDELVRRYDAYLATPGASLADIAFTAGDGRAHHPWRLAVVAADAQECQRAFASAERVEATGAPRVALTFEQTLTIADEVAKHPAFRRDEASLRVAAADLLRAFGLTPEWIVGDDETARSLGVQALSGGELARERAGAAGATLHLTLGGVVDWRNVLSLLERFYRAGGVIDWRALEGGVTRSRVRLPSYPFERRRHWHHAEAREPEDDLAYALEWERAQPEPTRNEKREWIVIDGAEIATQLRADGHVVHEVARVADLKALTLSRTRGELVWVTRPLALDVVAWTRRRGEEALAVTQWAVTHGMSLTIVTRGVYDASASACLDAALWGFGRTFDSEQRDLGCRLIDDDAEDVERLQRELADGNEREVRLDRDGRWVQRLSKRTLGSTVASLRADRSYLVVGGKRGIGALAAERLVALGAKHVAVISRSKADAAGAAVLERMRKAGATVLELDADVADEQSVASALAQVRPPIAGVIHAAAVFADAMIERQTIDGVMQVAAPKVQGLWWLAQQLPQLDFLIVYSSIAGALGTQGQANYAAACATQDAIVRSLRARGVKASSLQWGVWSGAGAAAERGLVHRAASVGLLDLSPEVGLHALGCVLGDASLVANTMLSRMSWRSFTLVSPARARTVLSRFAVQTIAVSPSQLRDAPTGERRRLVELALLEHLRAILGHETIAPSKPFTELGMDSLSASELRTRLSRLTGEPVELTAIFEHQTLQQLTDFALAQLSTAESGAPSSEGALPTELLELRRQIATSGSELMTLRRSGSAMPLVLFPPAGGACFEYQALARQVRNRPVFACQDFHTFSGSGRFASVAESAEYYLWLLRRSGIRPPFVAAGWSLGGSIAYEVTQQVAAETGVLSPVLLLEPAPSGALLRFVLATRIAFFSTIVRRTKSHRVLKWLMAKIGMSPDRARLFQAVGMVAPDLDARSIARIVLGTDAELPNDEAAQLDFIYEAIAAEGKNNIDFWPGASPRETLNRSNLLLQHQRIAIAYRRQPAYAGPLFLVLAKEGSFSQSWRASLSAHHRVAEYAAKGRGGEGPHTAFMKPANVELYADDVNRWLEDVASLTVLASRRK